MKERSFLLFLLSLPLVACTALEPCTTLRQVVSDSVRSGPIVLDGPQVAKLKIGTSRVEKRILPELVSSAGQVEADANLSTPVMSPVSGRIEDVSAKLGDSVKQGQILARLASDDVALIESDLLKTVLDYEADREQCKVELSLSGATYERKKTLLEQGVAARAEFDAARHDVEKTRAALASLDAKRAAAITSASERLRLFGVPADAVEKVLARKKVDNSFLIRAPRSGVISARDVNPGQLVDTSRSMFVITDLSNVWLVAHVFETNVGKVKVGQSVELSVDTYPGQVFSGKIDYVADSIDPERTLDVRATVPNPLHRLKPRMFARMSICTGRQCVLAVPQAALQKVGEVDLAYVVLPGNRYEERRVSLGPGFGSFVTVNCGLKAGESVVVEGSVELSGQSLKIQESME